MQLSHFLSALCCLFLLAACSESHFISDASYRQRVERDFQQKKDLLPNGELFSVFDTTLTTYEREALEFLYAYMPTADITNYPGSFHLMNVRSAQQTAQEMPWGKDIPEDVFRHFVLPVRVNNEHLDSARVVFYKELKDRVKNMSIADAILEVNHWCHEKAVYQPSDARTSSPLATVRTAYGRCGEESTLLVAALRSVGIPARQVYTPRWAHTDDNHAWVEAWADGKWHFLGACEPEPVLDLGWFNAPASRGMLMHTKVFGYYKGTEEVMSVTPNYTEINVIDNYAPTAKAVVSIEDTEGNAVADALVEFKLYNYAEFFTVASKRSDSSGKCSLTAGKGDMLVWASKDDRFGFAKLSFGKQQELTVVLDKKQGDIFDTDIDIVPPVENANLPEVTPEQRAENDRRMAAEDSIRNAYVATFHTDRTADAFLNTLKTKLSDYERKNAVRCLVASRGNHVTIEEFLGESAKAGKTDLALKLLLNVSEKDLRDIRIEVLNDNLTNTPMANSEYFASGLLSPRVITEELTPYKAYFQKEIDQATAESYRKNPMAFVEWCKQNITVNDTINSQRIIQSPEGVWKSRVTDTRSRKVFFVAVCRSLGIPAWIDQVTDMLHYQDLSNPQLKNGEIYTVDFEGAVKKQSPKGILESSFKPITGIDNPKYYYHFTISRMDNGRLQLLNYDENESTWSGMLKNGTAIDTGCYMLTTGTRLANGGVLAHITSFKINEGETTSVPLIMRESTNEVQVIGNFNSESLFTPVGGKDKQSLLQACGRGYFVVGILGVNQEPTNHALKDIAKLSTELEKWGRKMVLLFPDEEKYSKFHEGDFPGLPNTIIYGIDTDGIATQIADAMKLKNKGNLPIFIIADTFNRVVFVSQGYTIGLGEQLIKVVHKL